MRFRCPKCGKGIKAADEMAGKRGKCPACGQILDVPAVANGNERKTSTKPKEESKPVPPAESRSLSPGVSTAQQKRRTSLATKLTRSKLAGACAVAGALIGSVIGLATAPAPGPQGGGSATAPAEYTAVFMHAAGIAFMVGLGGGLIGLIISACMPRERTTCPECGSSNATAAYKSIVDGKEHPNRCPDCNHEW